MSAPGQTMHLSQCGSRETYNLPHQISIDPFNDSGHLPIKPLRETNGEWLRFSIDFPSAKLWIRTQPVQVGRAKLYLLDTNDPANIPAHRGITSELYGRGRDPRLKQEQVLGIEGWRLLQALGLPPEVCHLMNTLAQRSPRHLTRES
jgi:glycogen phosphorylase